MQPLEMKQMQEEVAVRDVLLEMLRQEAIEASQMLKASTQVMPRASGYSLSIGVGFNFIVPAGLGKFSLFPVSYFGPYAGRVLLGRTKFHIENNGASCNAGHASSEGQDNFIATATGHDNWLPARGERSDETSSESLL